MFKNWGSWLGVEKENGQVKEEVVDDEDRADVNKQTAAEDDAAPPPPLLQTAKGFSGEFGLKCW